MEEEIVLALKPRFPDIAAHVSFEPSTDRWNGDIISAHFGGMEFEERQRVVFEMLRAELGDDTQLISMLFLYTPAEYDLVASS